MWQDNNCDSTTPSNEIDDDSDGFVECVIDGDSRDGLITTNFTQMLGEDCDDADNTEYPGVIIGTRMQTAIPLVIWRAQRL